MDNPFKILQTQDGKFLVLENDLACEIFPFPFDTLEQARVVIGRERILRILKERRTAFS